MHSEISLLTCSYVRYPIWRNEVTLWSVEMFWDYEPRFYVSRISPTPFFLAVAGGDHLVPVDLACEAYENAQQPKKLLILPGDTLTLIRERHSN